jgi:hypothetical protein
LDEPDSPRQYSVVFRDFRETFDRFFDWDRPLSTNLAELFCLAAA